MISVYNIVLQEDYLGVSNNKIRSFQLNLLKDTIMMNQSLRKEIERSLNVLDEKERDVISLFFGLESEEPYTLEEIGEKYDLSRERVRQIKEKALKKLRLRNTSQHLKSFLGEE